MNAEVDLALGPLLHHQRDSRKPESPLPLTPATNMVFWPRLIAEADTDGLRHIVQAGNIKGFLDRAATPQSIKAEAEKRNLSATQCCAYTDGTKLHIEMAVLANALGYLPPDGGMTGPRAKDVQEALQLFDFSNYGETPRIDYLLGAEPGGGVYLVVRPKKDLPPEQAFYLNYYKLGERPRILALPPLSPLPSRNPQGHLRRRRRATNPLFQSRQSCDVYAYAKQDLPAGTPHTVMPLDPPNATASLKPLNSQHVPISLLEETTILKQPLAKDQALTFDHLDLPDCKLTELWQEQLKMAQRQS